MINEYIYIYIYTHMIFPSKSVNSETQAARGGTTYRNSAFAAHAPAHHLPRVES